MGIYTSYFANLKNIPEHIVPIAISAYVPVGWDGLRYTELAPSKMLLKEYKQDNDEELYKNVYNNMLKRMNVQYVLDDLRELRDIAEGKDIVLVCYERPEKFCHRHLVAEWLNAYGRDVKEWKG